MSGPVSPPSRLTPSANGTAPHVVDGVVQPPIPSVANVPGWYDYSALHDRMIESAFPGAWLVEIGVFHGLSLRHLAHRAKFANRDLTVVGVDWGRGSPEHRSHTASLPYGNLASPMLSTLITAGVADDVALILAPSVKAAKFVPDGSCHMVFIDGDHSRDAVTADIHAWMPKVARGGFLCGHDWSTHAGVRAAVCDVFGDKNHTALESPSCWCVQL